MAGRLSGIILAGGKSTRLGRDKAWEPLLGVPLLQRTADRLRPLVAELVLVRRRGQSLPSLQADCPVLEVEDIYPDTGPLGGIFTGVTAAREDAAFVVACDMPLLQQPLLRFLTEQCAGHDGAVPVNAERFPEPMCAVYRKSCLPAMERRLKEGLYKITAFFGLVDIKLIPFEAWRAYDPQALSLVNANTEDSLARAGALLAQAGA